MESTYGQRANAFPSSAVVRLAVSAALLVAMWHGQNLAAASPAVRFTVVIFTALALYLWWLTAVGDRFVRYLLVIPSFVVMAAVTVVPLLYLGYVSLYRVTILNFRREWPYVGLRNYVDLLLADPMFWPSLVRSLQLLVLALVLQFCLGLGLALLCHREFGAKPLVGTILLLPVMTNTIVIGILWKYMLSGYNGFVNLFLERLSLPPQPWLTNQGLPVIRDIPYIGSWLVESFNMNYAFLSVILTNTWQWTPFVYLLLLAGLSSLPSEPFEAARVDGATPWQTFWYVTLPMLKPIIGIVLLIRAIDLMKTFGLIWALFGNAPITRTLNIHIHTLGLTTQNYSSGAALSLLVALLTIGIYLAFNRVFFSERTVE